MNLKLSRCKLQYPKCKYKTHFCYDTSSVKRDGVSSVKGFHAGAPVTKWWRDCVIYQLYVKSFSDHDGDGVGDLDGITARLDYIAALGVDGIWLSPCYPSPDHDGGYDVADYVDVSARYGGMDAFERLLANTHDRGLKLLMDLVPNHCSVDHSWFQEAIAAGAGSKERSRFIFRDGLGAGGTSPPNNWRSTFGGPAWTRITAPDGLAEQWYLHLFDSSQPDFNWGSVEVAEMFDDVLRAWFDRGVDGFRIDIAYGMVKHAGLPDVIDPEAENPYIWNQPGVHDIFKRWRAIADSYERELNLVGEAWLEPRASAEYIKAGELKQLFYFDLLSQPFGARAFKKSISESQEALVEVDGVPAWTLSNHDVFRSVTRYGLIEAETMETTDLNAQRVRARGKVDIGLGTARAKAATLLMMALPGSVYIYQGEELGLPEVQDIPANSRRDPIWERSGHSEHGRDGSRVPIPWSGSKPSFGFSMVPPSQQIADPWLPQPSWFDKFTVAEEESRSDSVLAFYREVLALRRTIDKTELLKWLDTEREDVLAFRRGNLISVTVFDGAPFALPGHWGEVVLRSDQGYGALPTSSGAWLLFKGLSTADNQ